MRPKRLRPQRPESQVVPSDVPASERRDTIAIYAAHPSAPGERAKGRLPQGYEFELFVPRLTRLHDSGDRHAPPKLLYLFWFLLSRDRYCIHYVRHAGTIVHASHVLTTNPKLAFMRGDDLQAGPCRTDTGHERRGIYAAVLRDILHRHRQKRVWIFAEVDNAASRRGIVAAGFRQVGWGRRRLGVYSLTCPQVGERER